jgi:hypothetical protein
MLPRHLKRSIEGPMLLKVNGALVLSLTPAEPVSACRQYLSKSRVKTSHSGAYGNREADEKAAALAAHSVLLLSDASVSVTKLKRSPNKGGSHSFTCVRIVGV